MGANGQPAGVAPPTRPQQMNRRPGPQQLAAELRSVATALNGDSIRENTDDFPFRAAARADIESGAQGNDFQAGKRQHQPSPHQRQKGTNRKCHNGNSPKDLNGLLPAQRAIWPDHKAAAGPFGINIFGNDLDQDPRPPAAQGTPGFALVRRGCYPIAASALQ